MNNSSDHITEAQKKIMDDIIEGAYWRFDFDKRQVRLIYGRCKIASLEYFQTRNRTCLIIYKIPFARRVKCGGEWLYEYAILKMYFDRKMQKYFSLAACYVIWK